MEKDFSFQGVRFHYEVTGHGHPFILMHGWGCNSSTVASIARVAEQTCTVYNVDFPGFGKSSEPDDIWGVDMYTGLIEELCRREGIQSPILAGHSFGGRVAILFASRNIVKSVILIDAAGIKPKRPLKYYMKIYSFKAAKWVINLLYSNEKAAKKIEQMRGRRGSSDYNNASPKMRSIMSRIVNEDLTDRLHLIKALALLIWGENDTATPLADAKKMERLIPDAGLVSFPGCGHYSFLDNPRQFAAVLDNFLKSCLKS